MTNNKTDGHLGHLAIAEQLEEVNQNLGRIATALERANEIEIGLHPLSVEEWERVKDGG